LYWAQFWAQSAPGSCGAGALAEAGDLLIPMREQSITRDHVVADLHELVTRKVPGRTSSEEVTIFKSVGCALEDLVTANLLWSKVQDGTSR
jgi:ornithine cyclodeaminase/alanine dehydrogenase-like protein (mu-crystallin family)